MFARWLMWVEWLMFRFTSGYNKIYQLGNLGLPRLLLVLPPFTRAWSYITILAIFPYKRRSLNLNLKTKLRTFPGFSHVPQSQFSASQSRGVLSSDRTTDIQTNIPRLLLYIYRLLLLQCEETYIQFVVKICIIGKKRSHVFLFW